MNANATNHPYKEQRPTLPLTLVAPGESAELVEIRLDGAEKQRLPRIRPVPGSWSASSRVTRSTA